MAVPLVAIKQGQLQGKVERDVCGQPFLAFYGIPYAKAPLGDLRFKDPQPPGSWEGIRDALTPGPGCIFDPKPTPCFSEDCLYLNIYTRSLNEKGTSLKPVMFYIHGGAFTLGSADPALFGPQPLMSEDVVLVTINYRTGALGFLSIQELGIDNAGLKDAVQALKWVRENIQNFNGDSTNVTIFGESAGGAAVEYLLMSSLAKGLFHKAIAQSGSALNPWARGRVDNYLHLANSLGCREVDKESILEYLQKKSPQEIIEGQRNMGDSFDSSVCRYFSPTIEKPSATAFISEDPIEILYSGNCAQVPIMIGYTSAEGGIYFFLTTSPSTLKASLDNSVPFYLGLETVSDEYRRLNKDVMQFYFGKDFLDKENTEGIIRLATDTWFSRGVHTSARLYGRSSQQPVYLYKMTAETELNMLKKMINMPFSGACHGDDIGYIFSQGPVEVKVGSIEDIVRKRFIKMWTNFARTGNPIPTKDTLLNIDWRPVAPGSINYMEIGRELKPGSNPDVDRMEFWDKFYSQMSRRY